jgi:hypothetical protein
VCVCVVCCVLCVCVHIVYPEVYTPQVKLEGVRKREADMRRQDEEEEEEEDYTDDSSSVTSTTPTGGGGRGESLEEGGGGGGGVQKSVADMFRLKEGEWDCGECYTRNKASSLLKCVCCEAAKPGASTAAPAAGGSIFGGASIFGGSSPTPSLFGSASFFGGSPPISTGDNSTKTSSASIFGGSGSIFGGASLFGGNI